MGSFVFPYDNTFVATGRWPCKTEFWELGKESSTKSYYSYPEKFSTRLLDVVHGTLVE